MSHDLTARYIDTCLPGYLTDGYNRPGQALMYCSLGSTIEDTIDALIDSLDCEEWEPGGLNRYGEDQIKEVIRDAIDGVDLRHRDENGNPCDDLPEDDRDGDEPYVYVLLVWTP